MDILKIPDIKIVSEELENRIILIKTKGFLDAVNTPLLLDEIKKHMHSEKYKIILDIKNVEFISNEGWSYLVNITEILKKNRGNLIIFNMLPDVENSFKALGISSIIALNKTLEEAKKHFD